MTGKLKIAVFIYKNEDGKYNIGISNNEKKRFQIERDFDVIYTAEFGNILQAIGFEREIKNWPPQRLESLVAGQTSAMDLFQHCINETSYFDLS